MKSLWSDTGAGEFADSALQLRVYSSRLLGQNPDLVLHGGGNTSVKITEKNLFGDEEEILYVKGSGWDLGDIEAAGFAPVRLSAPIGSQPMEMLPTRSVPWKKLLQPGITLFLFMWPHRYQP